MDSSSSSPIVQNLVQEIAASLTGQQVPESFIHRNGYTPAEDSIGDDLLIDFSNLHSQFELQKLRSALSNYGCFQIVNHGAERELLEKVLEVSKRFFALPVGERMKVYEGEGLFNGYGNDDVLYGNQTKFWSDRLYLRVCSDAPADLRFWPENPPEFRKTVRELVDKIQVMPEILLKAMARSLDLQEDLFLSHHGSDGVFNVKLSLYPKCPNPDKVLGLPPHSDGCTLTMLLQDQQGLQVMANDRWFNVPVIPGSLFVNVGDLMEIMSNGVMQSTIHRVITDSNNERVSIGMFYYPATFKEVGPVDELITSDRPKAYKKTNIMNYGIVYKELTPKGERALSAFKV